MILIFSTYPPESTALLRWNLYKLGSRISLTALLWFGSCNQKQSTDSTQTTKKIKWEDQVLLAKSEVFKVFSLLGHVESFRPGQVLMPVIQLDYGKILVEPMQEDVSDLPSWLWDWEGIWFFDWKECMFLCMCVGLVSAPCFALDATYKYTTQWVWRVER